MKKNTFFIAVLFCLAACNSSENIDRSDPLASGRGFIEATLKGDYVKADKYILKDSTNQQYLEGLIEFNKKLTPLERESYRDADIIIDSTKSINDSTDLIFYKNTYRKEPTKLKLVKKDNEWLVDFKSTFHDEDRTLP